MRRRDLLALFSGATTLRPLAVLAQQKAMPVVGYLSGGLTPSGREPLPLLEAFGRGLSETGYVEGQNYAVEYRWADGHYDRLPALAADLVSRKVDVIVTTGTPGILAATSATSTIPIVFIGGGDLVAAGVVTSLSRPGGNLTGVSLFGKELHPKRLELLSELVPEATVIALLVNPTNQNTQHIVSDVKEVAHAKGVQLPVLEASTETEIDDAFGSLNELHAGALVVEEEQFFTSRSGQLVSLASRHNVPASYGLREFTVSGGLMSYGPSYTAIFRQWGVYAGRVLKGEKPAELPIQEPTKVELVINMKTAHALGLTVPPLMLARVDEVIE